MSNSAPPMSRLPTASLVFLLKAALWLLMAWWLATYALGRDLWQVLLAILLMSLPLSLLLLHQATVHKILRRQRLQPQGLLFRLFTGRTLSLLAALVYGWFAAIFLLLKLHSAHWREWLLLIVLLPTSLLLYRYLEKRLGREYKPWILQNTVLRWTRVLTALVLAAVALLLQLNLDAPTAPFSLAESIALQRAGTTDLQGSEALQTLALLLQTWEGFKQFTFALPAAEQPWLLLLAALLENWMLFYLVGMAVGSLLLDRGEIRRCFGPLTDSDEVPPLRSPTLVLIGAVSSFMLLFVLLPLNVYTELWARQQVPLLAEVDSELTLRLERIGEGWYQAGTWDSLQDLRVELLTTLELDQLLLENEVNAAFDSMEQNVDLFLDWYYSLGAEYLRIATMLTGSLDDLLAQKLTTSLQQGAAFTRVEELLARTLAGQEALQQQYLVRAEALLASNQVQPGETPVEPLRQLSLTDVLTPPVHEDLFQLQTRLLAGSSGGAAAGVMTSMITAKITSRMLAKGSFKLAAKALGKVMASKAGGAGMGAGAGAAAGAAAGSVIPGLGTAVGAVIGGIAGGILAGITIDKALIELEESVNRDQFKAEILTTITEARAEFMQGLQE